MRWDTTWSKLFRSTTTIYPAARRAQHGFHRSTRICLPGARSRITRPTRPDAKSQAEKTLNDFWPRMKSPESAGGYERVALDVRPSASHTQATRSGHSANRERHLEPLLRTGVSQKRRCPARSYSHMIGFVPLFFRLSNRPHDRVSDRRAK